MEKEFLLGLEVSEEVAQAILDEHGKELTQMQSEIRQARFDCRLSRAIAAAGGRNHRAIAALLDPQALGDADEETIAQAVEQVKQAADFLTGIFPLLFVPTVAGVMGIWDLIAGNLLPIAIAAVPVTWAVMAAAGTVTQRIMEVGKKHG